MGGKNRGMVGSFEGDIMKRLIALVFCFLLAGCAALTPEPMPEQPSEPLPQLAKQNIKAVCIGWDRVDPKVWNGWSGDLEDCEFDATFWSETWESFGIDAPYLLTEKATITNCYELLKSTVKKTKDGDWLIVCVSGHGGQEPDHEYICAYDGPIVDKTINQWLSLVTNKLNILWILDTCHSGDMYKSQPVKFRAAAIPKDFAGGLILLAGCSKDKYSLSTGKRGDVEHRPAGHRPAETITLLLVPGRQKTCPGERAGTCVCGVWERYRRFQKRIDNKG